MIIEKPAVVCRDMVTELEEHRGHSFIQIWFAFPEFKEQRFHIAEGKVECRKRQNCVVMGLGADLYDSYQAYFITRCNSSSKKVWVQRQCG